MTAKTILVNRAPVLTLWGAVVAESLGYDRREALAIGRAISGLNAQSKGRRLGIFKGAGKKAPGATGAAKPKPRAPGPEVRIELLGREIPARKTPAGVRAVSGASLIEPEQVEGYLERAFGEHLTEVRQAMTRLARAIAAEELPVRAFSLYEQFRPAVAPGTRGWGQKGTLDLGRIAALASKR